MHTYLVAYRFPADGTDEERDFGPFYVTLQSFGPFARAMDSVWFVTTPLTAMEVYRKLVRHFEHEDQLLVVECGSTVEWRGICLESSIWMQSEFDWRHYGAVMPRPAA